MGFVPWRKRIHCPNCGYEGRVRLKNAHPGWAMAAFLGLLLVSLLVFIGFFLVGFPGRGMIFVGLMLLWFILNPVRAICPVCKSQKAIPLARWRERTRFPPARHE